MRMRSLMVIGVVSVWIASGCSKDEGPNPNNIISENNGDEEDAEVVPDAGSDVGAPEDVGNNGQVDLGADTGFDFSVSMPGPMHGSWLLQTTDNSTTIATLRLKHSSGSTTVEGTFTMEEPASFGRLAGANFVEETFAGSWTVNVDGSNEQFGVSACTSGDGETYQCRYSATISGSVVDTLLVRQP